MSRTRSFDDGQDRWTFTDAAPDPALAGAIGGYGWWSERTATFDTRRELAGTDGTLIVNLASDLELVDAAGSVRRLPAGGAFVAGLSQRTSLSRSTGAMEGIYLRAPLAMLARIAGTSVAELTDRVVTIDDLPALRRLAPGERLLEARDDEGRWRVLDDIVAARLSASAPQPPALHRIAAGLSAGIAVETLAGELGWSRKRLARTFFDAFGLHPRTFAGLARFERFAALLQGDPHLSLAAIAIDAGYADQAHLTREVRRFAEVTPAALRRQVIPAGGGVRD
ncbi:helix-turn-helix domain-containing protein [Sphingomonas adhaesiva]|uniref:helix-turn-helix domain-containing protein n=1 Tax=Sphingomonas adhaesiva TaxID=28212 RepID=UPI002FF66525